jgi:hypothetical protein
MHLKVKGRRDGADFKKKEGRRENLTKKKGEDKRARDREVEIIIK